MWSGESVTDHLSVLISPGLGNSGPGHWQSLWREGRPDFHLVVQEDWNNPDLDHWLDGLGRAIEAAPSPVLVVAHSLSCPLLVHYVRRRHAGKIAGALLVAPADIESPALAPFRLASFAPVPLDPLPFPAIVVLSRDDPYAPLDRAARFASAWGARIFDIGAKGHVNAESGLGDWPQGLRLLEALRREILRRDRVVGEDPKWQ